MSAFGSRANLKKLASFDCSLSVVGNVIKPYSVVRDLGEDVQVLCVESETLSFYVSKTLVLVTSGGSENARVGTFETIVRSFQ